MQRLIENIVIFWLRGRTTIRIPWWRVPRCFSCNRLLWDVPTITAENKEICWQCERDSRMSRHSLLDLELAFGKPTEVDRAADEYLWNMGE